MYRDGHIVHCQGFWLKHSLFQAKLNYIRGRLLPQAVLYPLDLLPMEVGCKAIFVHRNLDVDNGFHVFWQDDIQPIQAISKLNTVLHQLSPVPYSNAFINDQARWVTPFFWGFVPKLTVFDPCFAVPISGWSVCLLGLMFTGQLHLGIASGQTQEALFGNLQYLDLYLVTGRTQLLEAFRDGFIDGCRTAHPFVHQSRSPFTQFWRRCSNSLAPGRRREDP